MSGGEPAILVQPSPSSGEDLRRQRDTALSLSL